MKPISKSFGHIGDFGGMSYDYYAVAECPCCGQLYTLSWKSKKRHSLPSEIREVVLKCKTCSAKNSTLGKNYYVIGEAYREWYRNHYFIKGYNLITEEPSAQCEKTTELIDILLQKREQDFQDKIQKKIDTIIKKTDKLKTMPTSNQCDAIKNSPQKLLEYLDHVIKIESGLYYITTSIFMLARNEKSASQQLALDLAKDKKPPLIISQNKYLG